MRTGAEQRFAQRISFVGALMAVTEEADAGHDVARQYGLVVVKAQALAQGQRPRQPIFLDLVALDHLRLRRPVRIDEVSVVTRRTDLRDYRVQHAKVLGGNKD
jgi:hypothetical protein